MGKGGFTYEVEVFAEQSPTGYRIVMVVDRMSKLYGFFIAALVGFYCKFAFIRVNSLGTFVFFVVCVFLSIGLIVGTILEGARSAFKDLGRYYNK